jgi:hypothetical protein
MLADFRKFALRGNVIDLAIGVIIGAAFSKIVDSLVNDIIMPIIGARHRRARFLELLCPADSRDSGPSGLRRRQEGGRRSRLRAIPHGGDQLFDHRLHPISGRARDRQARAHCGAKEREARL